MKVLMLNGSAKTNGNTMIALTEVGEQLKKEGIDYEIFQIGGGSIRDCIGCQRCTDKGCVFEDDSVNEFIAKLKEADGLLCAPERTHPVISGSCLLLKLRLLCVQAGSFCSHCAPGRHNGFL